MRKRAQENYVIYFEWQDLDSSKLLEPKECQRLTDESQYILLPKGSSGLRVQWAIDLLSEQNLRFKHLSWRWSSKLLNGFHVILWLGFLCQDKAQVWKTTLWQWFYHLKQWVGKGNTKLSLGLRDKVKWLQGVWTSDMVQIWLTSLGCAIYGQLMWPLMIYKGDIIEVCVRFHYLCVF